MGKFSQFVVARLSESVDRAPAYWRGKLNTSWKYAKVEMAPPSVGEIVKAPGELMSLVGKSAKVKDLSVRQCVFNAFVFVEVMCWFFVGEVIGKRHVRGYYLSPEAKNTYDRKFRALFDPYPDQE